MVFVADGEGSTGHNYFFLLRVDRFAGDFLATVFFFAGLFAFEAGFLAGLFFLAGDLAFEAGFAGDLREGDVDAWRRGGLDAAGALLGGGLGRRLRRRLLRGLCVQQRTIDGAKTNDGGHGLSRASWATSRRVSWASPSSARACS